MSDRKRGLIFAFCFAMHSCSFLLYLIAVTNAIVPAFYFIAALLAYALTEMYLRPIGKIIDRIHFYKIARRRRRRYLGFKRSVKSGDVSDWLSRAKKIIK